MAAKSMRAKLDSRPYLTPEHVAERLGSNRLNVFKLMDSGRLKFVNIGCSKRKFRRTSEEWLAEFMASETVSASA